ncbi:MAG: thiamine phosphate synthase [Spirochaetales bacterium]|nr:thiamine phosphate synthase [Spirochaetales bacterium]
MKGYYFITDATLSKAGIIRDVKEAISAGVKIIQYRNKNPETRVLYEEAALLKEICGDAMLLINDRIDIALAIDADGVHIGQEDMPLLIARKLLGKTKTIGVTVHNLEEALEAESDGADYLGISPVFATATKSDAGKPCGLTLIEEIRKKVSLPLIAIGGITLINAKSVVDAGADGICSISEVVTKPHVKKEILKFMELFI